MSKPKTSLKTVAIIGTVAIGTGAVAYLIAKRIVQKARSNQSTKDLDDIDKKDPRDAYAVSYAQQIRAAFNPADLDNTWMSWIPDGTDEEALYRVAKDMRARNVEFSRVAKAYRNLYQSDLVRDLTSELDTAELRIFYGHLGMQMQGLASKPINAIALI
jgi:hypothetical protein